ncbi:MAG: FtsB family cell division protein [Acidimicrobiales bacterium]
MKRAWPLVVPVVVVGILFVAVFPSRTYLAQTRQLADAEGRVAVLTAENRRLEARKALLSSDAEVERIAREQYDLVRPGEEAYAILPSPSVAPAVGRAAAPEPEPGVLARAWDAVTFWD